MSNRADKIYNEILKEVIYPLLGKDSTYSTELFKIGKLFFKNRFIGVYPSDQIHELKNMQCEIINLDNSRQEGSHWIALARMNNKYYFYDSFGRKHSKILKSLKIKNIINTEEDAEQHILSEDCGARCMAWLCVFFYWNPTIAVTI